MPGIAGIIRSAPYEGIEQDLHTMVHAMRHEPNYSGGQYVNRDLGLYVGWMSHSGSFADCMPLVSPKKDTLLIFQGENYLDSETRGLLRAAGKQADEHTAGYLVDLYDELGDVFLRHLNGWFCGLIADLRARRISLFNDRYGMGRIYFCEGEDEFLFASEAKSLLKIRPALRTIKLESLAEYLRFTCVTRNETLFRGISLLPPAASWEFEAGTISGRRRYFQFADWETQTPLSSDGFYEAFSATLSRTFPPYATSSGQAALSLTAGLDTRAIMASLRSHQLTLPCYTFDGPWGELFDVRAARRITKLYGQHFEVIRADQDFFKDFPAFAQQAVYISDGTQDAFAAHDVYLNRIARNIAPVRLTGKFGSEVVRVRKLVPTLRYRSDLLRPEVHSLVEALPPFPELRKHVHPLTRVVSEEIPWREFGRVSIEQSQLVLRTPYMDNELVKLMFQAPHRVRAAGDLQEQYVREKTPELTAIPTDLGRFVSDNRLIGAFGQASRWALFKAEYIYLYALPHWLTRVDRMLGKMRPEQIVSGRQKWEAYRIWLTSEIAESVRQMLLNRGAHFTDFFERKTVEEMVARHTAGTHNFLD